MRCDRSTPVIHSMAHYLSLQYLSFFRNPFPVPIFHQNYLLNFSKSIRRAHVTDSFVPNYKFLTQFPSELHWLNALDKKSMLFVCIVKWGRDYWMRFAQFPIALQFCFSRTVHIICKYKRWRWQNALTLVGHWHRNRLKEGKRRWDMVMGVNKATKIFSISLTN